MAIADIVTYGFGNYGSVNKVPTHGFSIGTATMPDGVDFHATDNRPYFHATINRPHYRTPDNRPHYEVS